MITAQPSPPATSSLEVPSALSWSAPGGAAEDLRTLLPEPLRELVAALDDQLRRNVYEPLLHAQPGELADAFRRLHGTYAYSVIAVSALALAALDGDIERLFLLGYRGLDALEQQLRTTGSATIGEDAALAALAAIQVQRRLKRALLRTSRVEPARWLMAQTMALSTIAHGLGSRGRPENMRTLAYWSRSYAVKAYAAAKDAGVLPPPPATGPIPDASTEEDLELAKLGLAGYRRILDG